jgi:adenylate cyclase
VFLGQAYRCLAEFDLALSHFERGVALNPNDANGIAQLGYVLAIAGRAEEGVKLVRQAMRLNPFHPDWYWNTLTIALYAARRYEEALEASRQGGGRTHYWQLARGAACLAQLGRLEEARKQAAHVLRIKPDFHLSADPSDAEHVFEGMRKAGLPD